MAYSRLVSEKTYYWLVFIAIQTKLARTSSEHWWCRFYLWLKKKCDKTSFYCEKNMCVWAPYKFKNKTISFSDNEVQHKGNND